MSKHYFVKSRNVISLLYDLLFVLRLLLADEHLYVLRACKDLELEGKRLITSENLCVCAFSLFAVPLSFVAVMCSMAKRQS